MAQFIDTNILVYAHDAGAGEKHSKAQALLRSLWATPENSAVSIQVLQEFSNVGLRKLGMSFHEIEVIVDSYSIWNVHSPTSRDIIKALQLMQRYQTSFWDALILNSAAQLNCSILWSEDLNHGQTYGSVQIRNPFSEDNV